MTDPTDVSEAPPKTRQCLRCRSAFESNWSGERICGACKSTKTWKSGDILRSVPSRSAHARASGRES
mgnify:CR=1 FL=1